MAYERSAYQEVNNVEEEWKESIEAVSKCATEVCECRLIEKGIKKGSEWWNNNIKSAVSQKRKVFEHWLHQISEEA